MTNILKNFVNAGADAKTGEKKVNNAAVEKNAMKSLLEGLDSAQRSVNQMPGTHTMAKNGAKHPASKFLVGGEFEEETNLSQDQVDLSKHQKQAEAYGEETGEPYQNYKPEETNDQYDKSTGKWSRSDAPDDSKFAPGTNVHVGHMTPHGSGIEGEVVRIEGDWIIIKKDGNKYKGQLKNTTVIEEDTISKRETPKPAMKKKQSLADLFRSMEETEEDIAGRFKKELHNEKTKSTLRKGDNGKFNLAEEEDTGWGDELLEDLKLLLHDADNYEDLRDGVLSAIQQYEA